MNILTKRNGARSIIRLSSVGLAAGLVNGLLGAGGGILIVFGLAPLLEHDEEGKRDVFANALAVMFPVSVVSLIGYLTAGRVSFDGFYVYLIPCAVGGLIGALLLDRIKIPLIQKLFAAIVIWSGFWMIIN